MTNIVDSLNSGIFVRLKYCHYFGFCHYLENLHYYKVFSIFWLIFTFQKASASLRHISVSDAASLQHITLPKFEKFLAK